MRTFNAQRIALKKMDLIEKPRRLPIIFFLQILVNVTNWTSSWHFYSCHHLGVHRVTPIHAYTHLLRKTSSYTYISALHQNTPLAFPFLHASVNPSQLLLEPFGILDITPSRLFARNKPFPLSSVWHWGFCKASLQSIVLLVFALSRYTMCVHTLLCKKCKETVQRLFFILELCSSF